MAHCRGCVGEAATIIAIRGVSAVELIHFARIDDVAPDFMIAIRFDHLIVNVGAAMQHDIPRVLHPKVVGDVVINIAGGRACFLQGDACGDEAKVYVVVGAVTIRQGNGGLVSIPIAIAVKTFIAALIGRSGIPALKRAARIKVAIGYLDRVIIVGQVSKLIKSIGVGRHIIIEVAVAVIEFDDNAFKSWLACILNAIHDVILIMVEIVPDIIANDAITLAIRLVRRVLSSRRSGCGGLGAAIG